MVYQGRLAIDALAGKETVAAFLVSVLKDGGTSKTLAWVWALAASAWAFIEKRLRKRHIERFGTQIPNLERRIDPKRTSSHLLPDGDTNPDDRA